MRRIWRRCPACKHQRQPLQTPTATQMGARFPIDGRPCGTSYLKLWSSSLPSNQAASFSISRSMDCLERNSLNSPFHSGWRLAQAAASCCNTLLYSIICGSVDATSPSPVDAELSRTRHLGTIAFPYLQDAPAIGPVWTSQLEQ